ncbi:MAG: hydrogenase [Phycisphaera sp. RhM]|nr:hydrogenase [Phycisphaera sp. RhM]
MSLAIPNGLDNTVERPGERAPLVLGETTYHDITEAVCKVAERPPSKGWIGGFLVAFALLQVLGLLIVYLIYTGVGVWGNRAPIFWGWPIVNFVFWVGIGHAGTLISAILFLFRQEWRTSINRAAEAMTIFAVACAGTFPGIHVGRAWLAFWLAPYPSLNLWMWPQFRSPLLWDVFAVSTYGTVSLLFWYMGMVPDLATFRDRSKNKYRRMAYGILCLGWSGSSRHWMRYEKAYAILAALAAPLVLSVHTIVSFDFAVSQVPGWHTTIFPPYFVAGAIFSGFAMVLTLMVPARAMLNLEKLITIRHLENMCKIILATGSIVGLAYGTEFFIAWYGQVPAEQFAFLNRAFGPYAWAYWTMVSCNVISPQIFWFKKARTTPWIIVVVSIFVNIGMWFERFVIVISSLSRDYLPSAWAYFTPTWVDWGMLIGSFGLFFTLFLLFCRTLPVINMAEVKATLAKQEHMAHLHGHGEEAAEGH